MSKFFAMLMLSLQYAAVRAADIQDAPIPAPNYLGIFVFLVLMVGGCWWFIMSVMKNDGSQKPAHPSLTDKTAPRK